MSKVIPSDKFVLKILAEKEKGLTAKQIQTKHGVTPNQYRYIVYTLAKKLNENSANFVSAKKANTQRLIAQKKKQVEKTHKKLQPVIDSTNEYVKSTKSAQSVTVSVASATGANADVWEPMQKTVDYFYGEKEKKSLWKRLVSKIFFWYSKKA